MSVRAWLVVVALGLLAAACGKGPTFGGCSIVDLPITDIDGATSPAASPGETITLHGSFGSTVGVVRFTEGGSHLDATPQSWMSSTIVVTVPNGIAAPGTATVAALFFGPCGLNGETSNPVTLTLQ